MFFFEMLHNLFYDNNERYDVYLLYEHTRYLTNILYDIGNLFSYSILTYFLIRLNRKIFTPLFITSLFTWISYFTFYNQASSLLLIPIYLILVVYYNQNLFR